MMKIGFLQFAPARYDVAANLSTIHAILGGAQADLLVLPELANSGYLYATPDELRPFSEPADGRGPFLSALCSIAASTGGLIVAGFAERASNGLYNSAAAIDRTGVVSVYRKTHLFAGECDLFVPGDTGFSVLEYAEARIGLMICFDWVFPESARTLALKGAQILAHPANVVSGLAQDSMVTRSIENGVFSVTANRYGAESLGRNSLTFTGASQVLDPRGRRLLQAPAVGDCLSICEIEPTAADGKRFMTRNHLFRDRRPELYEL